MSNSRSYLAKQLAGEKLPTNTDQWDGYPAEREKFYEDCADIKVSTDDYDATKISKMIIKKYTGGEILIPPTKLFPIGILQKS